MVETTNCPTSRLTFSFLFTREASNSHVFEMIRSSSCFKYAQVGRHVDLYERESLELVTACYKNESM